MGLNFGARREDFARCFWLLFLSFFGSRLLQILNWRIMGSVHMPIRKIETATQPDDLTVIEAKHDREAAGRLFDAFYPRILSYCVRRVGSREIGEDVAAEVFLKMAEGLPSLRGESLGEFERWLYQIATNAIRARMRGRKRRRGLLRRIGEDGVSSLSEGDDQAHQPVESEEVYTALFRLNQRDQTLIVGRHMEGWGFDELAERLGIREGTVRVALGRAMKRLRGRLDHLAPSREESP